MGAIYSEDARIEVDPILVQSVMDFLVGHMEPDEHGRYSSVIDVTVDMLLDWRSHPLCNCGRPDCEAYKLHGTMCEMLSDNCNKKLVFSPMTVPAWLRGEADRRVSIVVRYVNEGFYIEDAIHIVDNLYKKLQQ